MYELIIEFSFQHLCFAKEFPAAMFEMRRFPEAIAKSISDMISQTFFVPSHVRLVRKSGPDGDID